MHCRRRYRWGLLLGALAWLAWGWTPVHAAIGSTPVAMSFQAQPDPVPVGHPVTLNAEVAALPAANTSCEPVSSTNEYTTVGNTSFSFHSVAQVFSAPLTGSLSSVQVTVSQTDSGGSPAPLQVTLVPWSGDRKSVV